jgi:hypothetical protein
VALGEPPLIAIRVGARLDVDAVGFEEVLGHGFETLRAETSSGTRRPTVQGVKIKSG